MANPYFQFKQFTVYHDLCAMKVGFDGVLLGAWTPINHTEKTILDVGCGSGLIALMIAQRSNAQIDAIDIDKGAIQQTTLNVNASKWSDRIAAYHTALQDFSIDKKELYDLIISNPPYFVDSLKAPNSKRSTARHTDSLTHEELLQYASYILKKTGRICIILPVSEGLICIETAKKYQLNCYQKVYVHPKPNTLAKRLLLEFGFRNHITESSSLIIETDKRHQYSDDYISLTKEFYLKM